MCRASGHRQLQLIQEQPVCQTGDEGGIAGPRDLTGFVRLEYLEPLLLIAPLPGVLNGIADGTLDLCRCAGKLLGNTGVELLCNGLHGILDHQQHCLPQIGIAPQLGGDAQRDQQIGDVGLGVRCGAGGTRFLVDYCLLRLFVSMCLLF